MFRRSVAQLGSARALGAWGRGFESLHSDHFSQIIRMWPRGQEVKTPPFHGDNRGSIPLGVTTFFSRVGSSGAFSSVVRAGGS